MKAASTSDIKHELKNTPPAELVELCLRLARFKKENKELLTYLLFEAHDEQGYIDGVKVQIDAGFDELPRANAHLTKKSLRAILRLTVRYIRYTLSKQAEAELLIYYCQKLKASGLLKSTGTAMQNLYAQQLKKINTAVAALHEDLQHDYRKIVAGLALTKEDLGGRWVIFGR